MKEEILKKMLEYLQNTELFLSGQLPDVFKQIMQIELFKLWALFIFAIICLIIFGICLFLLLKGLLDEDWKDFVFFTGVFLGGISGIVCLLVSIYGLYLFYFVPKVWLINYISSLIRG